MSRPPWLHDLTVTVHGNGTALSAGDGQITPGGAQGWYVDDVRLLDRLELRVAGEAPVGLAGGAQGPAAAFSLSARALGGQGHDPTVEVCRRRHLGERRLTERVTVVNRGSEPVDGELTMTLSGDGARIAAVKGGSATGAALPIARLDAHHGWRTERHTVEVDAGLADVTVDGGLTCTWPLSLTAGQSQTVTLILTASRMQASRFDADPGWAAVAWDEVTITSDDPRVSALARQSISDLRALLLRDPLAPEDVFAAAGTPWYLTLFGRDSLWVARMMLPFGTELALGTLRALARRQGSGVDPESAEQPGRIPHEVRRSAYVDPSQGLSLPPVYYGTVDATALWVCLLVESWRAGLGEKEIRELLPTLRAALGWLSTDALQGGLLRYVDESGHGLANQGWKDSEDAMRFRDGRVAGGSIALVEAQAYAVEAHEGAAALLDALGEPGSDRSRARAAALRRELGRFWVETDAGRHLAIALDGDDRPVDGLASNMGHVLPVLDARDGRLVADALVSPALLGRFGLRTLAADNGGYNPLGYHTGSIWTHDTAVTAMSLSRKGFGVEAARLAGALVDAGAVLDDRWPELFAGEETMGRPAPYPASCHPQAWAAASIGALVGVALGLSVDLPAGEVRIDPAPGAPLGALRVAGLRIGGHAVTVETTRDGRVHVDGLPDGVRLIAPTQ